VIEDSAHRYETCLETLRFLARHLERGEYLVIEDGVLDDLGWSEKYHGGPNAAIRAFFEVQPAAFEIDAAYCDMFGPNATYNPNGYLRKL
jgi:cephalosporin hydroxylase